MQHASGVLCFVIARLATISTRLCARKNTIFIHIKHSYFCLNLHMAASDQMTPSYIHDVASLATRVAIGPTRQAGPAHGTHRPAAMDQIPVYAH
jgi:hypothetical protein